MTGHAVGAPTGATLTVTVNVDATIEATSPSGAVVTYSATVSGGSGTSTRPAPAAVLPMVWALTRRRARRPTPPRFISDSGSATFEVVDTTDPVVTRRQTSVPSSNIPLRRNGFVWLRQCDRRCRRERDSDVRSSWLWQPLSDWHDDDNLQRDQTVPETRARKFHGYRSPGPSRHRPHRVRRRWPLGGGGGGGGGGGAPDLPRPGPPPSGPEDRSPPANVSDVKASSATRASGSPGRTPRTETSTTSSSAASRARPGSRQRHLRGKRRERGGHKPRGRHAIPVPPRPVRSRRQPSCRRRAVAVGRRQLLLRPAEERSSARPPTLRWAKIPEADYYNLQLWYAPQRSVAAGAAFGKSSAPGRRRQAEARAKLDVQGETPRAEARHLSLVRLARDRIALEARVRRSHRTCRVHDRQASVEPRFSKRRRGARKGVNAQEDLARIVLRVRRGGVTLQSRTVRNFEADTAVLIMNLRNGIVRRSGSAERDLRQQRRNTEGAEPGHPHPPALTTH